ncbi:MAG: CDP-alcohol phosphatidyltransferase family protein [Proteobacteria bacterium]|nr:CDP-alcohol phosphatidyltransferase family protein [Pseudomonadota bacterium]
MLLTPASDDPAAALRRGAAKAIAGVAALLAAASISAALAAPLASAWLVPKALLVFGSAAALVWSGLAAHAPQAKFGAANAITLARLALIALLAAGIGEEVTEPQTFGWTAVALASVAALLDAVDGPVARARREASAFGARFDMETDALLVGVLSALAWHLDRAGVWVLAAGAMRYAFVAAGKAWPWIDRPLPPSWRRKAVCVLQIVTLIACLCPLLPPTLAVATAATGLAALTVSFLLDLVWLARHRLDPPEVHA